jgi:hypothetical protein
MIDLSIKDRVLIRKGLYLLINELQQDINLFNDEDEEYTELTDKIKYVDKLIQCVEEDYNYDR